jgi:HEPN domain-containing protein
MTSSPPVPHSAQGDAVNRKQLQNVAKERLKDARVLLGRKRWAGSYYMSGYVIECGLKACLLRHLGESDAVFGDEKYRKRLADCWTHNLVDLISLAGLEADFGVARRANPALDAYWGVVKDWKETSRYVETRPEPEAREMFEAVSHNPDGVFRWIQSRW